LQDQDPADPLKDFLAKYTPQMAAHARAILEKMRLRLPGAVELVYDNYNALVIGFGPSERSSDTVFSIAIYPGRINLFFLRGARLPDPEHLLTGSGKWVRHITLAAPSTLDVPAVRTLMEHALQHAAHPFDPTQPRRTIIRSISTKQRPRRPR
jgi:hypothetical protein